MPHFKLGTGYAIPFTDMRGQEVIRESDDLRESENLQDLRNEYNQLNKVFNNIKESVLHDPYNQNLKNTMFDLGDELQKLRLNLDLINHNIKESLP